MDIEKSSERLNQLSNELAAARQRADVLRKEAKAAERKAERAEARCETLGEELAIEQLRLWGDTPDIAALLDARGGMAFYQILQRLADLHGLGMGGAWRDTRQMVLHVALNRGEIGAVERKAQGIRFFAPAIKTIKGGWARFNVTHSDMKMCAWHLHYSVKRNDAQLVQLVYEMVQNSIPFPDLEAALRYIEAHLWLENVIDQVPPALP